MTATQAQLESVLTAAKHLLGARQDQMVTVEEWTDLARAVAACTGGKTADLLTRRDFDEAIEYQLAWNEAVDGPLPESDED